MIFMLRGVTADHFCNGFTLSSRKFLFVVIFLHEKFVMYKPGKISFSYVEPYIYSLNVIRRYNR